MKSMYLLLQNEPFCNVQKSHVDCNVQHFMFLLVETNLFEIVRYLKKKLIKSYKKCIDRKNGQSEL